MGTRWIALIGLGLVTLLIYNGDGRREFQKQQRDTGLRQQENRILVQTPTLKGSIRLEDGRFDHLSLTELKHKGNQVRLFERGRRFAVWGWNITGLEENTEEGSWILYEGEILTPETPITLQRSTENGLVYRRTIEIDTEHLFTITQRVRNHSNTEIDVVPYTILYRDLKDSSYDNRYNSFHTYDGVVAKVNGKVHRIAHEDSDLSKELERVWDSGTEYTGFADRYTLAMLIPGSNGFGGGIGAMQSKAAPLRVTNAMLGPETALAVGETATSKQYLYAGPKKQALLEKYQEQLQISDLEEIVYNGIFQRLMVKPIRNALFFFHEHLQNLGFAILATALLARLLLLPVTLKGYLNHITLSRISSTWKELEKTHSEEQTTDIIWKTLKTEQISLMSVLVCVILELVLVYAFYVTVVITPEFQGVPFYGYVDDLSQRGERNLLNLFGLLGFQVNEFLQIGFWPLVYVGTILAVRLLPAAHRDKLMPQGKLLTIWLIAVIHVPAAVAIWIWTDHMAEAVQRIFLRGKKP